jgi:Holliday junction resolvasome RuvABC endonuclease subunit
MILAIDPSITDCGYAVLEPGQQPRRVLSGTWHPSGAKSAPDRFDQLADFILQLIRANRIQHVAVEIPDGGERFFRGRGGALQKMGGKSERTYAQAVGVCRGAARAAGADVMAIGVSQWKGRTKKAYTALIVEKALGHKPADDNESDALGLSLYVAATLRERIAPRELIESRMQHFRQR